MPPLFDPGKCTGCGTCTDICNSHILRLLPETSPIPEVKFPDECWHCNSCVLDCPAGAVTLRMPLPYSLMYVPSPGIKEVE